MVMGCGGGRRAVEKTELRQTPGKPLTSICSRNCSLMYIRFTNPLFLNHSFLLYIGDTRVFALSPPPPNNPFFFLSPSF